MGRLFIVDILADQLRAGDIPSYETGDIDEDWFFLDEDGHTWKTSSGRRCYAPEFEFAGPTKQSVIRHFERTIATICMLQEHGGTAILAWRNFMWVKGVSGDVWSLTGSLIMTPRSRGELNIEHRPPGDDFPTRLEIDDSTIERLNNLDLVEEVHDL